MPNIEATLQSLGYTLPPPPPVAGNYVPSVQVGSILYLSGTLSIGEKEAYTGKIGETHSIEDGQKAARIATLNALANIKATTPLETVDRILFLDGFVNAPAGFKDSPAVINGASDFLVKAFGDAGKHARAAVAVAGLPANATVEIKLSVQLKS